MSSGSVVVPGEFRVDTGSHKLYYRPRLTPIEQQTIIAPTVDRINDIDGASDIHFEGPTFKVSNGLLEVLPSLVLHSNVKGGLIHLGTARCWDPSQPNEEYSRHVDYIVNKAESLGLYVGAIQTRWHDPREGTYQDVGRFPTIGTRGFSWNEVTDGPQESRTGTPTRQSAMEGQTGKSARPTKDALQPHTDSARRCSPRQWKRLSRSRSQCDPLTRVARCWHPQTAAIAPRVGRKKVGRALLPVQAQSKTRRARVPVLRRTRSGRTLVPLAVVVLGNGSVYHARAASATR